MAATKIKDRIYASIDKAAKDQGADGLSDDNKESIKRILDPIIDDLIKPVVEELEALNKEITKMHSTMPGSFAAIGAGLASAGALGNAAYTAGTASTGPALAKQATSIKKLKMNL